MPPQRKKAKRPATFNAIHESMYGLRVTERALNTSAVLTVSCRFCVAFGRCPVSGTSSARKPLVGIKAFRAPFRVDHFRQHLLSQHFDKWGEYSKLEHANEKAEFFQLDLPFIETLPAHFEQTNKQLTFLFDCNIIEQLIGALLFHPDDEEEWGRALSLFKLSHDSNKYYATVANGEAFTFSIRFISIGLSFRQTSRALTETRSLARLRSLTGISGRKVAGYARITTAHNLQKIADLLKDRRCWAFSIAFDGATCSGKSFVDVRARICIDGTIENLHILAVPIHDKHTGDTMFKMVAALFDELCPSWKTKLLSASTDGARNMTGRFAGAVTRLEQVALPGFVRIWCGAHQLDLIIQSCFQGVYNEGFYGVLTALIGYLRRQQNLIADMRSTCPKVASTRWLSLGKVSSWLVKNRLEIGAYLTAKNAPVAPSPDWWIRLSVADEFMSRVDICFKAMQGMRTIVQQQRAYLQKLVHSLIDLSYMNGPLSAEEAFTARQDPSMLCADGFFSISQTAVDHLIEDRGLWAVDLELELDANVKTTLHGDIARLFVSATNKIQALRVERDSSNNASECTLPPVTVKELMILAPREFNNIVLWQRQRLLASMDDRIIESIQEDFRQFKFAVVHDRHLRHTIASCKDTVSFEDSWRLLQGRFRMLEWFCGGLATAFPGTATVEADFSLIKWEYDDFRQSLTSFSLEGILQAKQFSKLDRLSFVLALR